MRATTARDLRSAGALKVDLMLSAELACSVAVERADLRRRAAIG
jgi:hypothetical protein